MPEGPFCQIRAQMYLPNLEKAMWSVTTILVQLANRRKVYTLPFISVQRTLYPVLYRTAYKYRKRAVIS